MFRELFLILDRTQRNDAIVLIELVEAHGQTTKRTSLYSASLTDTAEYSGLPFNAHSKSPAHSRPHQLVQVFFIPY